MDVLRYSLFECPRGTFERSQDVEACLGPPELDEDVKAPATKGRVVRWLRASRARGLAWLGAGGAMIPPYGSHFTAAQETVIDSV